MLWGATFASGDGTFVIMIIDYFARTANALWGVESNARQHPFVNEVLGQYIDAHQGTPAQKALTALRPKPPR